jgi:hypothetical protein
MIREFFIPKMCGMAGLHSNHKIKEYRNNLIAKSGPFFQICPTSGASLATISDKTERPHKEKTSFHTLSTHFQNHANHTKFAMIFPR